MVPVDRLVDLLWDRPPRSARQQLHNAVGALRRALGPTAITWNDVGYRIEIDESDVDAFRFQTALAEAREAAKVGRLAAAIDLLGGAVVLWRGDVLPGLGGDVIGNVAAQLHEQRLVAVEELAGWRLRLGESATIVGELRQWVGEYPLREALRSALMLALHRSGRQIEALAVYEDARRSLADELGLDPGPLLRETHAAILADDASSDIPAPVLSVEVDAAQRARSYLPRDASDFAGRSVEMRDLLDQAKSGRTTAVAISVIAGMGGVGKTALAIHLAHGLIDDYPDGQYFIDLHGFTRGMDPATPEQVLDTLLRDSGVPPEMVPASLERRSALWRSRLAGKRVLLVLDNAVDAAHVRPLLPGTAGPLVLVTSRRKLTALEGASPVPLDVLPAVDAIALFTAVVGPGRVAGQEAALAEVVDLCGRLPLAIRIAAARLRDRAGWRIADLVERLSDHTRRARLLAVDDRSVLAVLEMSCRYLTAEQSRLFRLLGLHPGTDFDLHAVAALAGLAAPAVDAHMERLLDDNLVKQDTAGRFYLHDLVRDCARHQLDRLEPAEAIREAEARLLDYYLWAAHTWSADLRNPIFEGAPLVRPPAELPAAPSEESRMDRLRLEYRNLLAAARAAIDRGSNAHAWQFACVLHPVFKIHNFGSGAVEVLEGAAAAAVGETARQAACAHALAAVFRERGDPAAAGVRARAG
ncbi:DNA-binding SARP family transcriptional activator [Actinokineospora baliensis]|nr:DNA-binding SARP family transcriptional activator [Actinokineospora baliensis]